MYTEKDKDTPASNLYKVKRENGEGSAVNNFGKLVRGGSTYFSEIASSSKDTAKEKPSTKACSISIEDISF